MAEFDFPHVPPDNCYYEYKDFRKNMLSIWLCDRTPFNYTNRTPIRSIWGFYNTKTKQYYAPINATKQGDKVSIDKTSAYTAMQIICTPLELAFNV
tara:strand:- start:838 stop:1125 length:288 start_codon:yes stop_codon:yes gene_type:complete